MNKKYILDEEARRALIREVVAYYVQTQSTFRKTAEAFNMSKSWVQRVLREEAVEKCPDLLSHIDEVVEKNKKERYVRGGRKSAILKKEKRNFK